MKISCLQCSYWETSLQLWMAFNIASLTTSTSLWWSSPLWLSCNIKLINERDILNTIYILMHLMIMVWNIETKTKYTLIYSLTLLIVATASKRKLLEQEILACRTSRPNSSKASSTKTSNPVQHLSVNIFISKPSWSSSRGSTFSCWTYSY